MTTNKLSQSALAQRAINRPLADRLSSATADVERIVAATYRVIETTGTVDPTIRDIVKEAGVSTQAFYRYFSSKDELLLVLFDDGRRQLAQYLDHRLSKHQSGRDRITAWVQAMFAQAANPDASHRTRPFITNHYRLVEEHPDEFQTSVSAIVELLDQAVSDAATEASLATSPNADDVMSAYYLTVARMETHIVRGTAPDDAEIENTIAFILRGLGLE